MPAEQPKPAQLEKKRSTGSFFGLLKSGKSEKVSEGECNLENPKYFGKPLADMTDLVDGIPRPIHECLSYLSSKTTTEGLFRLSASIKDLEMARMVVDKGLPLKFSPLANGSGQEHIAASLVKSFLRELPSPILGTTILEDAVEDLQSLKTIIHSLPIINQSIVRQLFEVLKKVDADKELSKMDASNLALVIGPNLMWIVDDISKERISPSFATKIAFQIIQFYDVIFKEECLEDERQVDGSLHESIAQDQPTTPESSQTDLDIIISAIYELQKEIYDLKEQFDSEVAKRVALEQFVMRKLGTEVPVDTVLASSLEDLDVDSDASPEVEADITEATIE